MHKQNPANYLFSPSVRKIQSELGSADFINRLAANKHWNAELSNEQCQFITQRDSFYIGTASKQGQPYIQHRGGSRGFVQVEDASTLWFPDYAGNRQYISFGNLRENNQSFMFFMDYRNQRRLKLWGQASVHRPDKLPSRSTPLNDGSRAEHAIQFIVKAVDENCRQYITPRYAQNEYLRELDEARQKIILLKQEIELLKAE